MSPPETTHDVWYVADREAEGEDTTAALLRNARVLSDVDFYLARTAAD